MKQEKFGVRPLRTLIALTLISGCAALPSSTNRAPDTARAPAATENEVWVDLPEGRSTRLPPADLSFVTSQGDLAPDEIGQLIRYISQHREALGARGEIGFSLVLKSQRQEGSRRYVRLEQIVFRRLGQEMYAVPIIGASIIAFIEPQGLVRLNSHLMTPISLGPSLQNPGFEFAWTDSELALFMTKIKTSPESQARLRNYFAGIASRAKRDFDFDSFLNRSLREQRETLNWFFGTLGRLPTARILIDLARDRKLAIVRHGTKWMFQIEGFFGLPVEFDIEIPQNDNEKLTVKNLRQLHISASNTQGFTSPYFPNKPLKPGGPRVEKANPQFRAIMDYFTRNFSWPSFAGPNIDHDVIFHTGLKSLDFRGNSAWLRGRRVFVIGEDGDNIGNFESSISVLGHEFMHAIIQSSSGIGNCNDAGTINEHAADVIGASIEGEVRRGGKFPYHIGADVLLPPTRQERKKLLRLALSKYQYSRDQIKNYELSEPSLRHLYAPALSYAAQFDHLQALRKVYPEDCQPSDDNDNCGIHLASGVPNRAIALLMATFGVKETVKLVFRTIVNRMNPKPSLVDYVVQLHEECRETPSLASRCDAILTSFAQVGISHPSVPVARPTQAAPSAGEAGGQNDILPHSPRASTPLLRFCGWVDRHDRERIALIDGQLNASVMRSSRFSTSGNLEGLRSLDCACASGHITQLQGADGKVINAFIDIEGIEDRGSRCESELAGLKPGPASPAKRATGPRTVCGWVSVESTTNNIRLIDPTEDVGLIASPTKKTGGDFAALYREQCACVTGKIGASPEGMIFKTVSSVAPQAPEACIGIPWH